jgi:hypothetical protein
LPQLPSGISDRNYLLIRIICYTRIGELLSLNIGPTLNDGLVFVLSFGVVISLLIGVSYNGSNATSSLEEREKIPL